MTTKRERLEAAIANEAADRPPVALWRHFPVDDQDPDLLAEATLAFQREFDFDFVKVSPASSFCLRDWGARDEWRGDPEGTRDYTRAPIAEATDWRRLPALDPARGSLGGQLECLRRVGEGLGVEVPFIATVFSPLAQAKNLAGEGRLLDHLHREPEAVLAGLEVICRTTVSYVQAARQTGIAGIYYAVQHASYSIMDREAYGRFGESFDRRILEAAQGLWLNVLHLHGVGVMFDLAESYPVAVVNWHDRDTDPSLAAGRNRVRAAACGGLSRAAIVLGNASAVRKEAAETMKAARRRGIILGTGCVVPVIAPWGNLRAAREAVTGAHSHWAGHS